MRLLSALIAGLLLWTPLVFADAIGIQDEGGATSWGVAKLNCVGAGISCSKSGIVGTVTVTGGGGASVVVEEDEVAVDSAVTNFDFKTGFDITSSPAGEANIVLDFTEFSTLTLGAGAFTTLTFDAGATDPVFTASSGVLNLSTGTLQQGGTAVVLQTRTLTGGAGIAAIGDLSADRTIATASGETDFLASGALTCGAATQGRTQVHTTPLQYCDNAATPVLRYAAYASSTGVATSATALAANGANCSAGNYPLGVDASGASESCTADDDVPESGDFGAAADLDTTGAVDNNALKDRTGGMFCGGTASTAMDCEDARPRIPSACTIQRVDIVCLTAPTTTALIVDVNECSAPGTCTSIWNVTQANRVQCAASATSGSQTTFDDTTLAAGNYIGFDIDQVGSGTAGADITVTVTCRY